MSGHDLFAIIAVDAVEGTIVEVLRASGYTVVRLDNGLDFGYQQASKVTPRPGMKALIHTDGSALFVDGREVFSDVQ